MIVGTFNKIPKAQNSHSYGWARTWSENLNVDIDHTNGAHDKVYLLHGANFCGGLNLFGGFTEDMKNHVNNLMTASEIVSLDIDMPDYGAMLKKRKDVVDKSWCDALTAKISNAKTLLSSELAFEHLAVGDSHTAAYSPKNSSVVKLDGTTLNGQINDDFAYIRSHIKPYHKSVTICLGNIDVRHHIVRLNADWKTMWESLFKFGDSLGLDVEYTIPWPIEYEGRKLPKTGYYKDKPFWGSQEERAELVENIKEFFRVLSIKSVQCPDDWYKLNPEFYAKNRMEGTQSVHLNPTYYRRKNWGEEGTLQDLFA